MDRFHVVFFQPPFLTLQTTHVFLFFARVDPRIEMEN